MIPDEVHLTDKQIDLVANRELISWRGQVFHLHAVERVAYKQWVYRLNGAYMGTQLLVKLDQGGRKGTFLLDSKSKDERLDDFREAWFGVVELLEAHVVPRLFERILTTVQGGGEHRFGGIVATAAGVKAHRPLARTIPWAEVTGTNVNAVGHLQVTVANERGKSKNKLLSGLEHWDAVMLPRLVDHLAGG